MSPKDAEAIVTRYGGLLHDVTPVTPEIARSAMGEQPPNPQTLKM